jgi:hypothetical protein
MSEKAQKNNKNYLKTIFNIIMARYFIFIILFLMLISFLFAYKLIISPVSASIDNEIKKINEDKKTQKIYLSKTLENISKYRKDYENLNVDDKAKIDLMIPDVNDAEKLFTDIELLILKNGFILNSLEINSAKDTGITKAKRKNETSVDNTVNQDIGIIDLKLDVSNSSYKNFKKLLGVFENNLRIMDVHNINFSLDGASVSFEIKTYYLKQNVSKQDE